MNIESDIKQQVVISSQGIKNNVEVIKGNNSYEQNVHKSYNSVTHQIIENEKKFTELGIKSEIEVVDNESYASKKSNKNNHYPEIKNYEQVNDKSDLSVEKFKIENKEKFIELEILPDIEKKYMDNKVKEISEENKNTKDTIFNAVKSENNKYEAFLKDINSKNPLDYLQIAKSAIITQQVDKLVFMSGCEPPVRYIIEIITYMGEFKKLFTCRETHRWCHKNCSHGEGRMYTLEIDRDIDEYEYEQHSDLESLKGSVKSKRGKKILFEQKRKISKELNADICNQNEASNIPNTTRDLINSKNCEVKNVVLNKKNEKINLTQQIKEEFRDLYAIIHKDSQFWTCCNERPPIKITSKQDGKLIGKIIEPFMCTRFVMQLSNSEGKEKYRIDANSLQCGIGWRGSVFGKCYEIFFPIFRFDNPSIDLESADGYIHKKHTACIEEEEIEDAEAIEVNFPKDSSDEDKFLLICTGINIDYRFYEQNPHEIVSEAKLEG